MTIMLEYAKMILSKVAFDAMLFRKELEKSLRWLTQSEAEELREWVSENYDTEHAPIIRDIFHNGTDLKN
jgi:hypothetical protein